MSEEEKTEEQQHNTEIAIEKRMVIYRKQRKLRRQRILLIRLRAFLRVVLIALLIYCGYKLYNCKQWYLDTNTFNSIESPSIKISGNVITPNYKILNELRRADIKPVPIFLLETKELEQNVESLVPIKKVYIRRYWWPARLVVMVDERRPILTIAPSEDVQPIAFFAQGGVLIGRDYLPLNPSTKTYLILTYGTRGDDYRNWDEEKVSKIERLARLVEINSGETIEYLDFRDPKDVYIKIQTTTLRLGEFNSTATKRVKSIALLLGQVKKMDKPVKYIDLRWEDSHYIKLE